jgi:hypothetical protein
MPRGDRTGPMGMGAMTGRGAGLCAGFGMPGYSNPSPGRGLGMGYGQSRGFREQRASCGRGRRNMFCATGQPGWMRSGEFTAPYSNQTTYMRPDPEMEKQTLRSKADALQSELEFIRKRLCEIETCVKAN